MAKTKAEEKRVKHSEGMREYRAKKKDDPVYKEKNRVRMKVNKIIYHLIEYQQ